MDQSQHKLIVNLLEIQAVQVRPQNAFQWSSGLYAPIYCDNRLALSYPEIRNEVISAYLKSIAKLDKIEGIAGVATAGIPWGAIIADQLKLPFVYIRSKSKGHGKENLIEGRLEPGSRWVVIEDLFSTGNSSIAAAKALEARGATIVQVLAIFSYGLKKCDKSFEQAGYNYEYLINLRQLLEVAKDQNLISTQDVKLVEDWIENPIAWSEVFAQSI